MNKRLRPISAQGIGGDEKSCQVGMTIPHTDLLLIYRYKKTASFRLEMRLFLLIPLRITE
jgi:hypothetical protein